MRMVCVVVAMMLKNIRRCTPKSVERKTMDAEMIIKDLEGLFKNKKNALYKEKNRIEAQLEQLTKIEWDVLGYIEDKKKQDD